MSTNELERNFGLALQGVVTHLIKNARKIPAAVLNGALAFENGSWEKLAKAERIARLAAIAEQTLAPSEVHRHYEAYPHSFSKRGYARYLNFLKLYQESLGE